MCRRSAKGQLSFKNFYLPFSGKLSGENRWVKLAELIPWESFESEYAAQFSTGERDIRIQRQSSIRSKHDGTLSQTIEPRDYRKNQRVERETSNRI